MYAVPVYFIAGLKMNILDFLTVFAILFLLVYCSRTLAMFSASVMPTFQLSCFFAQTFFSMYIMSAGFFINLDNIFDGEYVLELSTPALVFKQFYGSRFSVPVYLVKQLVK